MIPTLLLSCALALRPSFFRDNAYVGMFAEYHKIEEPSMVVRVEWFGKVIFEKSMIEGTEK